MSTPKVPLYNIKHLIDHTFKSRNLINRRFRLQAPFLLDRFPYVGDLGDANQMLDTVLAFDKIYRRPTKAGVDLANFEVFRRKPITITI